MGLMETPLNEILAKSAHEYYVAALRSLHAKRHTFVYL